MNRETEHREHNKSFVDKIKDTVDMDGRHGEKHHTQDSERKTMHDNMPAHHETTGAVTQLGADPTTWAPVEGRHASNPSPTIFGQQDVREQKQFDTVGAGGVPTSEHTQTSDNVKPFGAMTNTYTASNNSGTGHSNSEHKPSMMDKAKGAMHGLTDKMHKR